ncbi:NAD(P)-dependent oxidoreductase [Nocardia sp. GCM10030253]|uniref:NAD(P)-dependent oxidoreductase n=1 Tax=Nocardia sp. GCM10030253 TaxID=3273404 RepID=UPI00363578A5
MRIGFVGAGRMGAPMVRRLSTAGHEVHVLAHDPEKRAALTESRVSATLQLSEIGTDADAVVVCVFTDEQVRAVCLDGDLPAAMPPGSALVVHTTTRPHTMTAVAERAAQYGVDVLDAPVSGGPHDIAAGTLTIFLGGTDTAVRRVRSMLSCYADPILHVGPLGSGQQVKLLNNAAFAAQLGMVVEIVRLADRFGLDEAMVLRALPHGSAGGRALAGAAARGSVGEFVTAVHGFLAKDVAEVRSAMAESGGDLGTLEPLIDALEHPVTG